MALLDNLVSYWKLDEVSGNAIDAHGVNDLTDNNAVGSAAGKLNNGRDFEDGSAQYFSIADNTDLSTGDVDFTLSVWFKPESISAGVNHVFSKGSVASSVEHFLRILGGSDNNLQFAVDASAVLGALSVADELFLRLGSAVVIFGHSFVGDGLTGRVSVS